MTETFEHGTGYARDPKGELFLRATTMFYGQDSFYENASVSDDRSRELARDLAVTDWEWFSSFLVWLRSKGNIRTMSTVLAVEGVRARLNGKTAENVNPGVLTNRQVIEKVLQRPDEPGKMLLYYFENYVPGWKPGSFTSKSVPKPIQRGIGDALSRMLTQKQALRYDKPGDKIRLGDVLEVCHPKVRMITVDAWPAEGEVTFPDKLQGLLFRHLITSRHNRDGYEPPVELKEIRARWELNQLPPQDREAFARKVHAGDQEACEKWRMALAGSWEWGKLWLGER